MTREFFTTTHNNQLEFLKEGELYYSKYVELIKKAHTSIHLQTYIFLFDDFGTRVASELKKAALRGVKVYLLVDGIGSKDLSVKVEIDLVNSGVYFCRFNSFKLKWFHKLGRRLHHKVLLIDEQVAIVGGINVQTEETLPPQLDFAILIEGPLIVEMANYCKIVFKKAYTEPNLLNFVVSKHTQNFEKNGYKARILVNDWLLGRSKITQQYAQRTTTAKDQITIINPYFFPRRKFMRQLSAAALRGVRVRLILPKHSDWPTYILASEHLYNYFLKANVEIYQWTTSKLHGKLATVDNNWTTIGSFNLNYTSYQQNLEMNIDIISSEYTKIINTEIESIIKNGCKKIDQDDFNGNAPLKIKIKRFFFYLVLSFIASLSIALTYKEGHSKIFNLINVTRFILSLSILIIIISSLLIFLIYQLYNGFFIF
ncbi:MAG: hypothetical protein HOP07_16540 [Bacteriovoracaceae bacterium]|nr:hypothetical protein [Bacteriovoracaceae bacterium]